MVRKTEKFIFNRFYLMICLLFCIFLAVFTTVTIGCNNRLPGKVKAITKSTKSQKVTIGYNDSSLGKVEQDVTYGTVDGVSLRMDIYYPLNSTDKPAPALLYVHGGAWVMGDKASGEGVRDIPELVRRGYLVASVNYRLAPEYKFPAQIEDVKCAVRYLRANAKKYNLDPKKMGAFGGSAGGHLVSLLGLTDESAGFEGKGGYSDQSSRVQAVVDSFGPSDLTVVFGEVGKEIIQQVFGTSDTTSDVIKYASPVTYISSDAPPFLILHGEKDKIVSFSQSQELYDRMKEAGLTVTLVKVENAGHGFVPVGGKIKPTRDELTKIIADFFDKYLK